MAPSARTDATSNRAAGYIPGDTDLAWTRLTPWRSMLAAALDQRRVKVSAAVVEGESYNPSAELLALWLADRGWWDKALDSPFYPGNWGGGYAWTSMPDDLVITGDAGFDSTLVSSVAPFSAPSSSAATTRNQIVRRITVALPYGLTPTTDQ